MERLNEFVTNVQNKLSEFNDSLDDLKKKTDSLEDESKKKVDQIIADLELRKNNLQLKLSDLKVKGESAFDSMKDGISDAADSLDEAFKKAKSQVKNQDTPEIPLK